MRLMCTFAYVACVVVVYCLGAAPWFECHWFRGLFSVNFFSRGGHLDVPMAAKRCAWETKNDACGITLSDPGELSLVTGAPCAGMASIPAAQINKMSEGFAFVNFARLQEIAAIRTSRPCAVILKGFISQKITALGIASNRVQQVVLSLWDGTASLLEARAVSLVNLAVDELDFISKTHSVHELELSDEFKLPLLFEMRKQEAAPSDWKAYGTIAAFSVYVESLLKSLGFLDQSVLHKAIAKEEYLVRRVQVPSHARDKVYCRSGACSIQCRAIRGPRDPREAGLEVMRVHGERNLAEFFKVGEAIEGHLGVFASQGATYAKVADDHLAAAREHWFPGDERFNKDNSAVKCSKMFRLQGLPSGSSMKEVIAAAKSLEWNVVPIRIFHYQELASAIVAAADVPKQIRVATSLGTLLVTEEERQPRKNSKKDSSQIESRGDSSTPLSSTSSGSTAVRALNFAAVRTGPSLLPPPDTVIHGRVDVLEKQLGQAVKDIEALRSDQVDTKQQLRELKSSQDVGFRDLLAAISELKSSSLAVHGSPSHPVSPPTKQQRV
ncbi:unnamed protein product [Symbiodinium natans]|uniref:Uncharacterized protein n=1 Tax=Symbiodinium natans TaxID=878477 RepID=A0A812HD76_9DINO|nr:unnamed protein product [Symbiodinium natans]